MISPAPPAVAPDDRIYAIGDIHGRSDLLLELLRRIVADAGSRLDRRRTRLVLLGDYIDRGDQSRTVLDMLCALRGAMGRERLICLRGNHEAALLSFLDDPVGHAEWLTFGGRQTLASYGIPVAPSRPSAAELPAVRDSLGRVLGAHLDLLRDLPLVFRSGAVVFAHAGFDPAIGDAAQDELAVLWPLAPPRRLPDDLLLVHGHFDAETPFDSPNRVCLDTGAYYSGCLTAVRLDQARTFLSTG